MNKIAIKAAVEYCNLVEDEDLLFVHIAKLMESKGLCDLYFEELVNLVFTAPVKQIKEDKVDKEDGKEEECYESEQHESEPLNFDIPEAILK